MEQDTVPIINALKEVDEELQRIELAWVRGRISEEQLGGLEKEALDRKELLQSRLAALSPGDVSELERTHRLISAAEESLEMAKSSGDKWNFKEAPPLWLTQALVVPSDSVKKHQTENQLDKGTGSLSDVYDTFPDIDPNDTAKTLSTMLDRLEAEVWAEPEQLSVKGSISLKLPSSDAVPYPGHLKTYYNPEDNQAFRNPSSSE